jgi:hypothetical protein
MSGQSCAPIKPYLQTSSSLGFAYPNLESPASPSLNSLSFMFSPLQRELCSLFVICLLHQTVNPLRLSWVVPGTNNTQSISVFWMKDAFPVTLVSPVRSQVSASGADRTVTVHPLHSLAWEGHKPPPRIYIPGKKEALTSRMTCLQAPHGEMNLSCRSLGTENPTDQCVPRHQPCSRAGHTPSGVPDSQTRCVLEAEKATWQSSTLAQGRP